MKTIRIKIILGILSCSLLTAVIVGLLSIRSTMRITENDSKENMNYRAEAISHEMDASITRVEQSVNTLADVVAGKLDQEQFFTDKTYADTFTEEVLDLVFQFSERTEGAITSYIRYNPEYSNSTSGCFLTRDRVTDPFTAVTPTDFSMYEPDDLEHVGWYYIPVQNGEPLWMDPYLNSNINVYMISYVVPLYSDDGTSIGIVGMDIAFTTLTDMIDSINLFESGYGFLTKPDGEIIYHKTIESGTNLTDVDRSLSDSAAYLSTAGNEQDAYAYSYEGVRKLFVSTSLRNGMILILTAPRSEIYSEAYSLLYIILGAVVLACVVCAVVGVLVGNGLSKPIHALTNIIDQTAQLDLTSTQGSDILTAQKDEIGQMANGVNIMRTVFHNMIDSFINVEQTINRSIDDLDEIMRANNSRTDENSGATEHLAAGMEEATANTSQIVHNVEQVRNQSQEIYELALQSERDSQEIQNRAGAMAQHSSESSEKTHRMYDVMKEKSDAAIEHSKSVERIHDLTDDIKNISSQTNMLALNANIEAARAGEAGRGFAVVANEIGSLATQTMNTVNKISGIVEEVNTAVSSMNDCIEELMTYLEDTVLTDYQMFRESGEQYREDADYFIRSMSDVRIGIDSLEHHIEEIVQAAGEINGMTENSAASVDDIASRSYEMRVANEEGYQKLQDAREAIKNLVQITERFH